MILFLNRNEEKWPNTRQIKIAGRNHILLPLGVEELHGKRTIKIES
jgi:creatinine amidohydrolase/Fe(II)-dependent formamide hydrolase-like protein